MLIRMYNVYSGAGARSTDRHVTCTYQPSFSHAFVNLSNRTVQCRRTDANTTICAGRLSVTGQADIIVPNDQATISVQIVTRANSTVEAQAFASALVQNITDAVLATNYLRRDEDISTTGYSLNPSYDYICRFADGRVSEDQTPRPGVLCRTEMTGFEIRTGLSITVRRLSDGSNGTQGVGAVLDAAVLAGGQNMTVDSLSFSASKASQMQAVARARVVALRDALGKAEPSVLGLGLQIGPIVAVEVTDSVATTEDSGSVPQPTFAARAAVSNVSPQLQVGRGKTTVSSSISLVLGVCN